MAPMGKKKQILFLSARASLIKTARDAISAQAGAWELCTADGVDAAMSRLRSHAIDAVVADTTGSGQGGLALLRLLRDAGMLAAAPVIILSGAKERDVKRQALELGAAELLNRPLVAEDLIMRLRSAMGLGPRQDPSNTGGQGPKKRNMDWQRSALGLIWPLAGAGEFREQVGSHHVMRVGCYCRVLAEGLGLPRRFVEMITLTSPMHDIGKIGVPEFILQKAGALTAGERQIMQRHCEFGYEILRGGCLPMAAYARWRDGDHTETQLDAPPDPLVLQAASIALTHHEKWDGTGYPRRLCRQQIPLESRILAVVDVYDTLSHARPYKLAFSEDVTLATITEEAGHHFDPEVIAALGRVRGQLREIKHALVDDPNTIEVPLG